METRQDSLIGQTLGTCQLEKLVGRGGMGAVYFARQIRPSRNVAVKVLRRNPTTDDHTYQEFLTRFRREADVIARLEHVNIVPIYEYGEQEGLAYLVMPYLPGGSLRDVLLKCETLSLSEATTYIEQAASALDYAHAQGVIHRDLKPANFLLHSDGRVIVADFGIARIVAGNDSSTLTDSGVLLGTPEYLAPEMARGESIDYRVDIYELGIVLFRMLGGRVPFPGNTPYAIAVKHIQEPLPSLHALNPALPPALDAILQKATAKQREDRYSSAGELAQALRAVSDGVSTQSQSSKQAPAHLELSGDAPSKDSHMRATQASETPAALSTGKTRSWLLLLACLFVVLLLSTALFVNLPFDKGNIVQHPSPTTGSTSTTTTQAGEPAGTRLYTAAVPGLRSNDAEGVWDSSKGIQVTNQGTQSLIANIAHSEQLQGIFLKQIAGQVYPLNYVVQVQLQQKSNSSSDFGIYFRNQPGSQQGAYAFLVHPDGTWNAYVYNNTTGAPLALTGGTFGDPHAKVLLAVAVHGTQFSFYANGTRLGTTTDGTYTDGTVGIAVGRGGMVVADHFTLYAYPT